MSFEQVIAILRVRWLAVVLTIVLAVGAAAGISLLMEPKYKATADLIVDFKGTDSISGTVAPSGFIPGYLATQVDVIESHKVALKVVRNLKLVENPAARAQYMEATQGKGTAEDWLADVFLKNLKVTPSKESTVITLEYKANDPKFAALLANAFAQAYIETNLELRVEPAKQIAAWFDGQVKSLRADLENSQKRLSAYQQANGIVAADERLDVESGRLAELSSQLVALQGQLTDVASRQQQIEEFVRRGSPPDSIPEVAANSLVLGLKSELVRQEGKLQELSSQVGVNHPQYQRALEEIEGIRSKLAVEMKTITDSVGAAARTTQRRESEVRAALAAQKSRVLGIKHQRDELAVLIREVDNAQRAYDAAMTRYTQTSMEGQANQTNISLLNPAIEPLTPSSPRMLLNIMIAAFVGTIAGVGLAFMMEFYDSRIHSERDIADNLGLVPLASIVPLTGRWFGRRRAGFTPV